MTDATRAESRPVCTLPHGKSAVHVLVGRRMTEHDKRAGALPDWSGHEHDTSALLLDVLTTATSGSARLSRADRVLFTACEFWAAARNGSLMGPLREDPLARLRAAEAAFNVIGLFQATSVLHCARTALTESDPPVSLRSVVKLIETSFAELDEPVDRIIASYAAHQASARAKNTPVKNAPR